MMPGLSRLRGTAATLFLCAASTGVSTVSASAQDYFKGTEDYNWVYLATSDPLSVVPPGAAVRMPDGRVFVGGRQPRIFDGRNWTLLPGSAYPRDKSTVVLLKDGRILALGGEIPGSTPFSRTEAEIYDPISGKWTSAGNMGMERVHPLAVVMRDGRVLAAQGNHWYIGHGSTGDYWELGFSWTSEIYNPADNTWSAAAPMLYSHGVLGELFHVLGDGRIVAWDSGYGATSEIYDPVADRWSPVPGDPHRFGSSAFVLPDGRLFVTGGCDGWECSASTSSSLIFDPFQNSWSAGASLPEVRYTDHTVPLPDGTILTGGGYWAVNGNTFLYDPAKNTWSAGPQLTSPVWGSWFGWGPSTQVFALTGGGMYATDGWVFRKSFPPVAIGNTQELAGASGVLGLYTLDASASYDPDGDALVEFTWLENGSQLATGSSPTAQVMLPVGTHVFTLSVRDATGAVGTTQYTVVVRDRAKESEGQLSSCTTSLGSAQSALDTANSTIAALQAQLAGHQAQLAALQQNLASSIGDPAFVIPGATGLEQMHNLTAAVSGLSQGPKRALYSALGGKKK